MASKGKRRKKKIPNATGRVRGHIARVMPYVVSPNDRKALERFSGQNVRGR